ncbi:ATP-binding response regulator [Merismopedia glauca]|uniref:Circadian input-output histidine kinase CikA n=1 Tax=Merismopedia glauca CCAP 1448/3 TaxID=1296344 RepID=A0A2T1CAD5_9CYAN|nr:hybrid sensor histidine kinase/response regulator [Merismopedia glauca]PSB05235.1 hybrid sensor histidine kinase/response regulator [Merismopedia glauca CCAP 1448/3]
MDEILKILVVDDDEVDRIAVHRAFKKIGINVTIHEAVDSIEAIALLDATTYDCIFLDYFLPGKDGLSIVKEIRDLGNRVPLIVLTGQGDEQTAVELMKAGASDYLNKSRISGELLLKTVQNAIRIYKAEQQIERFNLELRKTNEQLKRQNQELEFRQQQIHLQNLKLVAASELKSRFLATMSHELKTPLNAIIAFSQILLRKTKDKLTKSEADMVERIFNNGQNLLVLINDILDLSRIEVGKLQISPEPFDITQLVTITVDELRSLSEQKKLSIEVDLNIQNHEIVNDLNRVRQVLVNLISNAIKFTESGGVTIELKEICPEKIEISVRDTGIGIRQEDMDDIFEPFHQINQSNSRNYLGTGLGLAITNSLLKMMQGSISVESEVGKGSVFRVELPRYVSSQIVNLVV